MTKAQLMHAAEVFDAWRVVPRIVLLLYGTYVYKVTFFMLNWYAHEPATSRGVEESAFASVVITAVTGFAPWILKIYADTGRNWSQNPIINPEVNNHEHSGSGNEVEVAGSRRGDEGTQSDRVAQK
jgi:hypothetical protein